MSGVKPEEKDFFKKGHEGHRLIQDHVAGIKKHEFLEHITEHFSIVEKVDFDKDCKFTMTIRGYEFIGFFDGKNPENKRFLEIKLSSTPWSLGKFKDSIQRKVYALAEPTYTKAVLITGSLEPVEWKTNKLKVFELGLTQKDRDEALDWINKGLDIFEAGDFNGGLDENGRCTDRFCPWGQACFFKHDRN